MGGSRRAQQTSQQDTRRKAEQAAQQRRQMGAEAGFGADLLAIQHSAGNQAANQLLARESRRASPPGIPAVVGDVLNAFGQPLEPGVRANMESRFGRDFGQVRVHTGESAARSAQAVDAQAYTVGQDIVFGPGAYAPDTLPGRQLIAHELAHTVQQRGATSGPFGIEPAGSPAEHEAHSVAQQAEFGGAALPSISTSVPVGIQRLPTGGPSPSTSPALRSEGLTFQEIAELNAARARLIPASERGNAIVGILIAEDGRRFEFRSGGGQGFYTHIEGKATATMKELGITKATLLVELEPCQICDRSVYPAKEGPQKPLIGSHSGKPIARQTPKINTGLPRGSQLTVVDPNQAATYWGVRNPATPLPPNAPNAPRPTPAPESAPPAPKPAPAANAPTAKPPTGTPVPQPPVAQTPAPKPPTETPAPKPAPTANTPTPKPPTEAPAPTPKPPAAETPAPAPKPAAAPPPKAAPVAEIPPKTAPAKPGVNPKASGKWSGVGGGLLGVFAPFIMGWVHQKAVEKRVEEQAQKEGYVSPEAPSGQGFLYDLGAWLLDPLGSAEKSVGIDKRFNFEVWRARIREKANSLKPGETLTITWDIGKCSFDFMGNQEVEQRPVTYTKQADGSWKVTKGNPSGTPDLNKIVSPDVPDEVIRAIIERNPCQQWA